MDTLQHIKTLIDLYYSGKTTLNQEEELRAYFDSDKDISKELKQHKALFAFMARERNHPDNKELFDDDIIPPPPVKSKARFTIYLSGIAAALVILIGIMLVNEREKPNGMMCEGTYVIINGKCTDDPKKVAKAGLDAIDAILSPVNVFTEELDMLIDDNNHLINTHLHFLEQLETENKVKSIK